MKKIDTINEYSSVKELYDALNRKARDTGEQYDLITGDGGIMYGRYDHEQLSALLREKAEIHATLAGICGVLGK